jgi:hypothetical protein
LHGLRAWKLRACWRLGRVPVLLRGSNVDVYRQHLFQQLLCLRRGVLLELWGCYVHKLLAGQLPSYVGFLVLHDVSWWYHHCSYSKRRLGSMHRLLHWPVRVPWERRMRGLRRGHLLRCRGVVLHLVPRGSNERLFYRLHHLPGRILHCCKWGVVVYGVRCGRLPDIECFQGLCSVHRRVRVIGHWRCNIDYVRQVRCRVIRGQKWNGRVYSLCSGIIPNFNWPSILHVVRFRPFHPGKGHDYIY